MNVIVLTVDALRYDCAYDHREDHFLKKYQVDELLDVGNMQSIAENGIMFSNMISTAPNTPPSHATIFSGLYPPRHGIRSFFHRKLPSKVNTIFEIFSQNGYETYCAADKALFDDVLELSRGADYFIDHDEGDEALFEALADNKDEDILLFQRFLDVHFPYYVSRSPPHENYLEDSYNSSKKICDRFGFEFILEGKNNKERHDHRKQWFLIKEGLTGHQSIDDILVPEYIKGINKFDQGRFDFYLQRLDELGILDDAVVVLMSDHGESVISQNKVEDGTRRFDHCYANIDDLVRVPFAISAPNLKSNGVVDESLSSTVDVLPTILDLVDIPEPADGYDIQGQSLLNLIDEPESSGSVAYSELSWWNDGQFEDAETFKDKFYSNESILDYDALMRHRSIRTPNRRYVRLGKDLTPEDWNKQPEEFIRTVIRKFRADWDNRYQSEINELIAQLNKNEIDRETIVDHFRNEGILTNRYALYDLETDPYEEVNLLHIDESAHESVAEKLHQRIEDICTMTAETQQITNRGKNSDEKVLENLEDLGYL